MGFWGVKRIPLPSPTLGLGVSAVVENSMRVYIFEDYCTVTQSVMQGLKVKVDIAKV